MFWGKWKNSRFREPFSRLARFWFFNNINLKVSHMRCGKTMKNLILLLFVFLSSCPNLIALDLKVRNFDREDYRGASQNWSVTVGKDGFLYFANNKGLVEFDGATWNLYRLPGAVITRAVYAFSDSIIYSGGYQELGYWKREKTGTLTYHSLNRLIQNFFIKNEEFWNINSLNDEIYFHSFNRIIVVSKGKAFPVELPGISGTMNSIRGRILTGIDGSGIYSIEKGKAIPFLTDPYFSDKTIRFILPYRKDQLMIGTASGGIVIWDGKRLKEWDQEWNGFLKKNEVNRAHLTSQGQLVIGTILGGILLFDQNENLLKHLDVNTGLQNNTVLGIASDRFHQIWLALDRGIDFISPAEDNGMKPESIPNAGAVYSAALFEGKIYLGTNQGLFCKNLSDEQGAYQLVPGTQGHIWDCTVIDNNLLVNHNRGTIRVRNGKAEFIAEGTGAFAIRKDTQSDLLIQATYSNLMTYRKENDSYVFDHIVNGFYDLIRYLEVDHLGNVWASHMHRGLYLLKLDEKRENVIYQKYFGADSVFNTDKHIHVFRIENRVVFTTGKKLYAYDDLNNSLIPYDELNEKLGSFARSRRIIEGPDHYYWFITDDSFALFHIFGDQVKCIRVYPESALLNYAMVDEYENICPVSVEKAILCLENGIAWLDTSITGSNQTIGSLTPGLREIMLFTKRGKPNREILTGKKLKVPYKQNNIRFRYSLPAWSAEPVFYQYRLSGIYDEWSAKSAVPVFRFDRLPPGEYTLQVKATDPWNKESQVSQLSIEVLDPWYQTLPARLGYFLILASVLILFRNWGIRQSSKEEKEAKEAQEKELIQLRNEKLNAEILYKSRELANSTMSIIKKNEFLLDLKRLIIDQKEQLGSRYPDKYFLHLIDRIDKNIGSHDDWQIFSNNFEQAHEQFLKNLKADHPELTANDLRLCAYLRMNLSSKEIAPMLGITVRAVENHRYRLRKKMDLNPEDNLIDLILKY